MSGKIANVGKGGSNDEARVSVITSKIKRAELYVKAKIGSKQVTCLLDTGCESSIVGRRLVPDLELERTSIKLYAANGTEIPVLGTVKLTFDMESHPITADLLVSDAIEELILGIDWLSGHGCMWDFGSATLTFHG